MTLSGLGRRSANLGTRTNGTKRLLTTNRSIVPVWGRGMAEWIAIWSAVQAVGTTAATGVAAYQIHALRRDQKAWRTLEACERYD